LATENRSSALTDETTLTAVFTDDGHQKNLLKELVATGKPVVLLNFSGRATEMKWESENVNAIMNVWFGGSETASATAETQRYVPRLLALLDIIQHARQYGLQLPDDHAGTINETVFSVVIDIAPAPPLLVLDAGKTDPLIINKAAGLDMDNHAPDWQQRTDPPP